MRALFEDLAFHAAAPTVSVFEVGLPSTYKSDLWLRTSDDGGDVLFEAYATRALAYAGGADIGSVRANTNTAIQTVQLSVGAATGAYIKGIFSLAPAAPGVWGYTSAPEIVTAENIRTMIVANTVVFGTLTTRHVRIGTQRMPNAAQPVGFEVVPGSIQEISGGSTPATIALQVPFAIYVNVNAYTDEESNWIEARRYANALASMLCDEQREGYGEILGIIYDGIDGPLPDPQVATMQTAVLRITAEYRKVFRDDIWPRG